MDYFGWKIDLSLENSQTLQIFLFPLQFLLFLFAEFLDIVCGGFRGLLIGSFIGLRLSFEICLEEEGAGGWVIDDSKEIVFADAELD